MNNWEKLCEAVNYLIRIGVGDEGPFHKAVEDFLKTTFQWPSEYVKHEKHVKIGSENRRIDTVLEGDGFGVIIEMKTLDNPLKGDEDGQLVAYMSTYYTDRDNIRCKYGLLIGKMVKVYFKSEPDKKPELVAAFPFDKDSKDGNSLFEILPYNNCSDEKLAAWMNEPHEVIIDDDDDDDDGVGGGENVPYEIIEKFKGIFRKIVTDEYEEEFEIYEETGSGFSFISKKLECKEMLPVDENGGGFKNLGRAYGYFFNKKSGGSVCLLLLPEERDPETIRKLGIIAEMAGKTLRPGRKFCETFKIWLNLEEKNVEEKVRLALEHLLECNNIIYEKLKKEKSPL